MTSTITTTLCHLVVFAELPIIRCSGSRWQLSHPNIRKCIMAFSLYDEQLKMWKLAYRLKNEKKETKCGKAREDGAFCDSKFRWKYRAGMVCYQGVQTRRSKTIQMT